MLSKKEIWDVKFVIIPDISRGKEHLIRTYQSTKKFFSDKYGQEFVMDGYSIQKNEYYDFCNQFDIIYFANPYDSMVHKYHSIAYAFTQSVLPIYISYGYDISKTFTKFRLKSKALSLLWKCYTDTKYSYHDYRKHQIIKGSNVVLAGYAKMDGYARLSNNTNNFLNRKKILIAPHHTINMPSLPLSNFLSYYNFILELPDLFPEIDFVFRPHPLLFTAMKNNNFWTEQQVSEYINQIESKGIVYSHGGDYLNVFSECDAIIHDCGSFTVEWLFTGKPGCFVWNPDLNDKHFTELMKQSLTEFDIARSREDIIDFIKKVILIDDCENHQMKEWVKMDIAVHYPNVSAFIEEDLRSFRCN